MTFYDKETLSRIADWLSGRDANLWRSFRVEFGLDDVAEHSMRKNILTQLKADIRQATNEGRITYVRDVENLIQEQIDGS